VINAWWEWPPATITRVIAVKNRSHNPKTTEIKLLSEENPKLMAHRSSQTDQFQDLKNGRHHYRIVILSLPALISD